MQLAGLAAILLALTWITPAARATAVLHDFTLIDGADKHRIQPEMARPYTAGQGSVFKGQAHEHKLRAIAHIFYLDNAKTLVSQRVDESAHSVRDQPVIASDADSRA